MITPEERAEKRALYREEIITNTEAIEIMDVSRMRLSQLVSDGTIIPIKRGMYLKDDIIAHQKSREEKKLDDL